MSVDLSDLVTNIKLEVSPPGTDLFPETTDAEWVERLSNAFWNARLDGMLQGYVEADGVVTPVTGTVDMPRDLQQVIVFMAAYNAIYLKMLNTRTSFRAKAGAVEYETQNSATVMKDLTDSLRQRYLMLLQRLADLGYVDTYVIDAVVARDTSLAARNTWWVGNR